MTNCKRSLFNIGQTRNNNGSSLSLLKIAWLDRMSNQAIVAIDRECRHTPNSLGLYRKPLKSYSGNQVESPL